LKMFVFTKRLIKKISAFFLPFWKIFLKFGYWLASFLKPKWRWYGWKFLWYLRQWAHPPIHILGRPQYAVATYRDFKLMVNLSEMTGGNLYYGRPGLDEYELDFLARFVRPGNIVFDIGANIGVYTLVFAKTAGNSGKVFSFEPVSSNFNLLSKNMELNQITNAELHNLALSDHVGVSEIFLNSQSGLSSFITTEYGTVFGTEKVRHTTLDKFVEKQNLHKLDFIKIDAEGWEEYILKGTAHILKKFKPALFVELNPKNIKHQSMPLNDIIKWLQDFGYKSYCINRRTQQLDFIGAIKDNYEGINFLFQ